jgi:adenosylcobinamide kinase/adenosylcobinamide-phosphate guanylyltransferase
MKHITLIVGGGRCGKSRHALDLAQNCSGRRLFVGTAQPLDDEMIDRIRIHRQERDPSFTTLEEPVHLDRAVAAIPPDTQVAVIDCLTVWLGNLMHHCPDEQAIMDKTGAFLQLLDAPPCDLIIVANEVGMGIIPENAMARQFRDLAGQLNQKVAQKAATVILMISGIAVTIKETNP